MSQRSMSNEAASILQFDIMNIVGKEFAGWK